MCVAWCSLPPSLPLAPPTADRSELTGCPWHDVKAMLRQVGLRPTRQRMALGWILFAKGDRHLTAEMLYEEATRAKVPVSLATIYNTLHQFTEVGLLRQVARRRLQGLFRYQHLRAITTSSSKAPTNCSTFRAPRWWSARRPLPPEGFEIDRVDVVVRLRRKS